MLTVGHSTRPIEAFIELLVAHGVTQLIDIRTVPRSRHNPQFNEDALPAPLAAANIGYAHASGLGGFRPTTPDSPNAGWRNLSFRGYADYVQTTDFAANLTSVIELARADRIALMCAEAVRWRCHRSLIADALVMSSEIFRFLISAPPSSRGARSARGDPVPARDRAAWTGRERSISHRFPGHIDRDARIGPVHLFDPLPGDRHLVA